MKEATDLARAFGFTGRKVQSDFIALRSARETTLMFVSNMSVVVDLESGWLPHVYVCMYICMWTSKSGWLPYVYVYMYIYMWTSSQVGFNFTS